MIRRDGQPPASRARVEPVTREQRVAYCHELLVSGRWHGGMPAVLGARWGVSPSAVKACAAEARRNLRSSISDEDREALRVELSARFDRLARKAEKAGNFPGAVAALREVARLGRLLEPAAHEQPEKQQPTDLDWGAIVASKRADA
jgi:hypothetical protein